MKDNFYITKDGILKKQHNTIYFVNKEGKRILPINKIKAIYAHGRLSFSSGVVSYLSRSNIPIHLFNYYGFYEASVYPREKLLSGDLIIKQSKHYIDHNKRLELARKFVEGCGRNIIKNLQYYSRTGKDCGEEIGQIENSLKKLSSVKYIENILNVEGSMWNTYYQGFNKFVPEKFALNKRVKRPPNNMINCLISFGNSLLYSTVLTEIYNTQLNPTISYLHEPFERRFSLSLDISEIFKPLIADRVIFKLINKKIINEKHFRKDLNYCLLNDKGRKIFLENYDEKLKTTIKHRGLGRKVSFQRLIRLECYKLIKHLLGTKGYKPFEIWW